MQEYAALTSFRYIEKSEGGDYFWISARTKKSNILFFEIKSEMSPRLNISMLDNRPNSGHWD